MDDWDETKLIEHRLNQVCASHGYNLEVGWEQTKGWKHPHHEQHKCYWETCFYTIEITARYDVPISSMLCFNVEVEERPGNTLDPDFTPEEISVPQETLDYLLRMEKLSQN